MEALCKKHIKSMFDSIWSITGCQISQYSKELYLNAKLIYTNMQRKLSPRELTGVGRVGK